MGGELYIVQAFSEEELSRERWLPIFGFDRYEVSDLGRVRSFFKNHPVILKPQPSQGYDRVCLYSASGCDRRLVHQLVLEAFVGPCPDGMLCRHFPDRTRSNNRLANLAWGTPVENAADRVVQGTVTTPENCWQRARPDRVLRGDRHWTRRKPQCVARGARSGAYTKPECVVRGSSCWMSKLTEGSVRVVQMLSLTPGIAAGEIAGAFRVSREAVNGIKFRRNWKHVLGGVS